MTLPIPKQMRDTIDIDPFFKRCALWDHECEGRIQIHHAFTYGGKRQNVLWGLVPLCEYHHRHESKFRRPIIEIMVDRIFKLGAAEDVRCAYPKSDIMRYVVEFTH